LTGGKNGNVSNGKVSNNFRPFSTAFLFRFDSNTTEDASFSWLWLILPAILLILILGYFVLRKSKKKKGSTDSQSTRKGIYIMKGKKVVIK
jgi:hypothetical protein